MSKIEELRGENRAEYGAAVIKHLSAELTAEYGKGFDASNLYKFTQFYKAFPTILDSACLNSVILHRRRHCPLFHSEWKRAVVCFQIQDLSADGRRTPCRNRNAETDVLPSTERKTII
ncbi:MAG: hypothetical protein KBT67_08910 [bacterium]|nr:hypothetical protein [Candidatus Limimorpha caballi]